MADSQFDDILIASDAHPYQHCHCGHLRRSHHPRCFFCHDWPGGCQEFALCLEHPEVASFLRYDSPKNSPESA